MSGVARRQMGQDPEQRQERPVSAQGAGAGQERMKLGMLRSKDRSAASQRVRWYQGYSGIMKADMMIETLARYVRANRLGDTVCGLRLEKRARGEYYFFLTLETDAHGELSEEVRESLEACPLLQRGAGGPYDLRHIETMVSGELRLKALGQSLAYRAIRQELADDPFRSEAPPQQEGEWAQQAERLLWYASSLGQGRWSVLHSACAALGAGEVGRHLARSLRILGHVDFSADGDRWSVTSPGIVEVAQPGGDVLRYHIGARTRPGDAALRDPQWNAPSRQRVGDDELSDDTDVIIDPGLSLAQILPSIAEFHRQLAVVGGVSPAHQSFARHDGLTFIKGALKGDPGLYEVSGKEGRTKTLLLSADGKWRQGEWYGLRYLALFEAKVMLPAQYDPARWELALPIDQRPPELYERALVLCSGLLPERRDRWWVYHSVPPTVADAVCSRLGMSLESHAMPTGAHE